MHGHHWSSKVGWWNFCVGRVPLSWGNKVHSHHVTPQKKNLWLGWSMTNKIQLRTDGYVMYLVQLNIPPNHPLSSLIDPISSFELIVLLWVMGVISIYQKDLEGNNSQGLLYPSRWHVVVPITGVRCVTHCLLERNMSSCKKFSISLPYCKYLDGVKTLDLVDVCNITCYLAISQPMLYHGNLASWLSFAFEYLNLLGGK